MPSCLHSNAFTFLEVLFSVIIIGIGFIMVAAMFPVAIQQSQQNVAEAAGVTVGRDALRNVQEAATNYNAPVGAGPTYPLLFPATGTGATPSIPQFFPLPLVSTVVAGKPTAVINQTQTGDRRYGWVGFYRRDLITIGGQSVPAPYAQVSIITAQATAEGQPTFNAPPMMFTQVASPRNTADNLLSATLTITPSDTITFNTYVNQLLSTTPPLYAGNQNYDGQGPVGDNALVLVVSSPADTNLVGQIFRLGTNLGGYTWSLAPGSDINPNDPLFNAKNKITVFVLGKPIIPNPTATTPQYIYQGSIQDVTATTGFIRINN